MKNNWQGIQIHFRSYWRAAILVLVMLLSWVGAATATDIYVPNFSFESQLTDFADPRIDSWQKLAVPGVTNAEDNDQLTGLFINFPGTPDFIGNADGNQIGFIFADPGAGIFQDFNNTDWSNGVPTHAFNATFNPGKSYTLTVGLTTSMEEPLTNGSTLQLSLYYREASSNMITVASTTVTYDTNVFTDLTHLLDFHVNVPPVSTNDAWAGQHIGIEIVATTPLQDIGGVWDVDNVRLTELVGVPNFSFESQVTDFADSRIDSWQKLAVPGVTNAEDNDQLTGLFINPPGTPLTINNAEGNQVGFIFADPGAGIFQDFNSTDWSNGLPTHAFNATYVVGKAYDLTVGLTSSTESPLVQGSTLQLSLYYRDAFSNMVTVGETTVTYDTNIFTNLDQLIDFKVKVPTVKATDVWAGQNIGIKFASTVAPELIGGVWDLDNVRLNETGIPNFSFESQPTEFVDTRIDSWQKFAVPGVTNAGDADQLTGLFINASGTPDFIDNAEGNQLAYIFADPGVGFFQDVNSTDWLNGIPTHAFNRKFKVGKAYTLTVGLTTSQEEQLTNGSSIELSLYYRDLSNNVVTVAANNVTYLTNVFTNATHLLDYEVNVPQVRPTDPWAGKNIGIAIQTTTQLQFVGGVWDLDNVRLAEFVPTSLAQPTEKSGQFGFTLVSDANLAFAIFSSTNLTSANWTNIATVMSQTGSVSFVDTNASVNERFYLVRQLEVPQPSRGISPPLPPLPPTPGSRPIGSLQE